MRFNLPVPHMVAEANERPRFKRKRLPAPVDLIVEILIFALVYLVSSLVLRNIVTLIIMIPMILTSQSADLSVGIADRVITGHASIVVNLFATLGGILGVFFYCRVIEGRKLATLGFRRGHILREYLMGIAVGFVLFSAAVLICVATGTMSYEGLAFGSAGMLVLFFLGFMVQGLNEEVLCRGYFLVSLARKQHLAVAVAVSSCAFGAMHLNNANVTFLAILNLVLLGAVLGVYILKRGNIWGVAAFHTTWNFAQGNIFGLEVSGINNMPSLFAFNASESGTLINGGAFGMEGGLAATAVLVVALVVTLLLKSADPAPHVATDPDVNQPAASTLSAPDPQDSR
ncbi:CAAX amino protease [Actinomycetota bacterium]|nr:CAAX amino protease [Actinomycetota bacterium]